jgi:glutamate 5-kinase
MVTSLTSLSHPFFAKAPHYFAPNNAKRLVVKVGSSLLVTPEGQVRRTWLQGLVDELAARTRAGQQIIVVSSGAVALGARRLGLARGGRASLEDAQAAAAVGQIELASVWSELFQHAGRQAAQILLTLEDLEHRQRYLNVCATLSRLLEAGAVPILNENDSVATEEIRFGDNDRLAARVAQAISASGVILLSDIDGLYTANPNVDKTAELMPLIEKLTPDVEAMAGAVSGSGMGSGGMVSKLQAARIATSGGCHLAIINGRVERPLSRFVQSGVGSVFPASDDPPTARKRYLAGRLRVAGQLEIDDGAYLALREGSSLLPAGVISIAGDFESGDVVDIVCRQKVVGRGLTRYSSLECQQIKGLKSSALEAILGYAPRSALIHRDNLVLVS